MKRNKSGKYRKKGASGMEGGWKFNCVIKAQVDKLIGLLV